MGQDLNYNVNMFAFNSDQSAVQVNVDVSSTPPSPGVIVYLFAAVGAEDPVLIGQGTQGNLNTSINIAKTRGLVGAGPGNKPVTLMVYACWVYTQAQAVNWIKANAAIAAKAGVIYLS